MPPEVEGLKRALQDLAPPAAVRFSRFPDWVVVGDELALAFYAAMKQRALE